MYFLVQIYLLVEVTLLRMRKTMKDKKAKHLESLKQEDSVTSFYQFIRYIEIYP